MATLSSTLRLSLDDNVSGPVGRVGRAITGMRRSVDGAGRTMVAPLGRLTAGFIGTAAAAVGISTAFDATVNPARALEAQLTEIGIKGELSAGQLDALRRRVTGLAPATNQFTTDLLSGIDTMMAAGVAADVAQNSIGIIGQTATATGSSMQDLANTTSALVQNLGVSPGSLQQALEAMTQAGNDGAFEVRDMATYFPQLTASARSLGSEGAGGVADLAAALQIARRGAGDASTAANNLSNFLGKLGSKETIANFAKMGVDVVAELEKVKKEGLSPIEHFIGLIDKTTKGGRVDLLSKLFGDKQVVDFIRPMIADFDDYIRIRERAENADGIIARQYATRMEDAEQRFKRLRVALSQRGTEIGSVVLGPIAAAADRLAESLNTLDRRAGVFDDIATRFKGFMSGLGVGDGSIGSLYNELDRVLFGDADTIEADSDRLGKAFLQFRTAGENFRGAIDAFSGADTLGGKLTALGSGLKAVTESLSGGSLLALGLGGLALARLGKGLFGLAFGSAGKLVLIAFGLSALAGAGGEMSAVDWAGVAIGVGMLAGPIGKLAMSLTRLGRAKAGAEVLGKIGASTRVAGGTGSRVAAPRTWISGHQAGRGSARTPSVPSAQNRPNRIAANDTGVGSRAAPATGGGFWAQSMGAAKALGMVGLMFDFVSNAGRGVRDWTPEQRGMLDDMIAERAATAPAPAVIAPSPSNRERASTPDIVGPVTTDGETAAIEAEAIGARIANAFNVTASATVNMNDSAVDAAQRRLDRYLATLARVGPAATAAAEAANAALSSARNARLDTGGLHYGD